MSPLGIYIHWPFCLSKCPYCDFNSHVRNAVDADLWHDNLLKELFYWHTQTPNRLIKTVFFGGGTPSLMSPRTVEALITFIKTSWLCDPKLEITLEANPNSIEAQKFQDFKSAGVNRVSVGIQSFNEEDLKFLGRKHSKQEALNALDIAAKTFDNYSFDLIYARPHQTWTSWQQELEQALPYARYHLSLYQLTIEPNTAFYTSFGRGQYKLPDNEIQAELYDNTTAFLKQCGFDSYEVSNYAQPNFECQHNLIYWRYQDYLAIGPGAHGRLTTQQSKVAITNYKAPETWLNAVAKQGRGCQAREALSTDAQFYEALLMGLRLSEGVPVTRLSSISSLATQHLIDNAYLKNFINDDYMMLENGVLKTTPQGRLFLNYILSKLL